MEDQNRGVRATELRRRELVSSVDCFVTNPKSEMGSQLGVIALARWDELQDECGQMSCWRPLPDTMAWLVVSKD